MSDRLREHLLVRIAAGLPGRLARQRMEPPLCYGRQRGPARGDSRHAGVLVLLEWSGEEMHIVLVRRSPFLEQHPGQIGFPGGGIHAGESWVDAAFREAKEEIGIECSARNLIGQLTPIFVHRSNHLMIPVLAVTTVQQPLIVDGSELVDAFRVTTQQLERSREKCADIAYDWKSVKVPAFALPEGKIWGATAMVLEEVLWILGDFTG